MRETFIETEFESEKVVDAAPNRGSFNVVAEDSTSLSFRFRFCLVGFFQRPRLTSAVSFKKIHEQFEYIVISAAERKH